MKHLIFVLYLFSFNFLAGQKSRSTDSSVADYIRVPTVAGYAQISGADSTKAGAMSAADKRKIDRIEVVSGISELKKLASRRTDVMYRLINIKLKNVSDFYWDPNSVLKEDSVMIIQRPGVEKGRFLRYYDEIFVEWFGAIPDDNNDDSYAFQKAIDFAIRYGKSAKVKCGGGVFNVKNLVVANYTNGNAGYVAFTLEGVAPAYDGMSISSRMTELRTSDGNAFTIGIQRGANVSIKNISFRGAGAAPDGVDNLIRWTDKDWNNRGSIRDNPLSPHAAIVIDPFLNTIKTSDQYPGTGEYYSNAVRTGSSCVLMEGCAMKYYIVAIMITPAPGITNADNISFQNGIQFGNKVFWASGQSQSRSNSIVNLYSFGALEYLVNCRDFGAATGAPPTVLNSSIAGGTKYLYNTLSNFGSVKFVNTYMESVWSFGWNDGDFPAVFENCDINLEIGNTFSSPVLAQGGPIQFRGGYLAYFDNTYAQGFTFSNQFVSFDGTTIKGGAPVNFFPAYDMYGPISLDNVIYSNTYGHSVLKKGCFESPSRLYLHNFVIPDMTLKGPFDISYKPTDNYIDLEMTERSVKIKTDPVKHTAWFITPNAKQYSVGNYLTTNTAVDYSNDLYRPSRTGLGWVSSIGHDTITLSYVPFGLDASTGYMVSTTRLLKFIPRTTGTVSAGSNVITDIVSAADGKPMVGEYIKGTGIPANTRVVSVSDNSITITQNATSSGINIELYDARMFATGIHGGRELGYNMPFWFFGDIMKNFDPANPGLDYIRVVSGGAMGSARPPKIVAVNN